jgi:hypothetical protein
VPALAVEFAELLAVWLLVACALVGLWMLVCIIGTGLYRPPGGAPKRPASSVTSQEGE